MCPEPPGLVMGSTVSFAVSNRCSPRIAKIVNLLTLNDSPRPSLRDLFPNTKRGLRSSKRHPQRFTFMPLLCVKSPNIAVSPSAVWVWTRRVPQAA